MKTKTIAIALGLLALTSIAPIASADAGLQGVGTCGAEYDVACSYKNASGHWELCILWTGGEDGLCYLK